MPNDLRKRLTEAISVLSIPGVGPHRYHRLIKQFGSASAIMAASISELEKTPGISRKTASVIAASRDIEKAKAAAARIVQLGWRVHFSDHNEYPKLLRNIKLPPPLLFSMGRPLPNDEHMIAIVGTRTPSEGGRMFAFNLARSLALKGIVVVSGMAEGIDSSAHAGALEVEDGLTVAVWGSSLDIIYPPVNRSLAQKIENQGTVVSEYLPGTRPDRASFPQRNRIISGLSMGVVVVEAGPKSGALITARYALEQGREVFAVPGSPGTHRSEGTNSLIKDGARLLTSVEDIFDELPGLSGLTVRRKVSDLADLTETEKSIVSLFDHEPLHLDQISRSISLPVDELMEFMLALELKGVIRELAGKRFVLAED